MPRSRLSFLSKLFLAGALAAVLMAKADLLEIASFLTWDKLAGALVIQPFVLFGFVLGAVRLATLTNVQPKPFAASFKAIMLCYGANVALPARVSELLKATYLRNHAGVKLGAGFSAVFLERIADVLMLGLFALAATATLLPGAKGVAALMALAALSVLFGLPIIAPRIKHLAGRLPSERMRGFLYRFIEHSVERMTHRAFLGVLALTVLMWLISLAGITVLFSVIGSIPIGIRGALVVFAASTLGGAVPALPGGFGIYEAAVVFVLRWYGYDFNEALALALTLHGSQIAMACVVAPMIALRERTGVTSLIRDALAIVRNRN